MVDSWLPYACFFPWAVAEPAKAAVVGCEPIPQREQPALFAAPRCRCRSSASASQSSRSLPDHPAEQVDRRTRAGEDWQWRRYEPVSSSSTPPSCTTRKCWKRSEEHTSELQSLMRISYAAFCLQKKTYILKLIT